MDAAPRRSPPFRRGTRAYVLHYLRGRAPAFAALLLLVTAAACCAVAVQYTMKLLVDAVAAGPRDDNPAVWWALYLFIGLIVAEDRQAEILRAPAAHPMPPARRRALLHRFAMLAASRLHGIDDPAGQAAQRAALRVE